MTGVMKGKKTKKASQAGKSKPVRCYYEVVFKMEVDQVVGGDHGSLNAERAIREALQGLVGTDDKKRQLRYVHIYAVQAWG